MGLGLNSAYWWNTLHALYFASSALAGVFLFTLWKSSHRGGLSSWRATLRPALMSSMITLMGVGLTWDLSMAAGAVQLVGYFAVVIAAGVFAFAWLLRGPSMPVLEGDAYWQRAWANVFLAVAISATLGTVWALKEWTDRGHSWEVAGGLYEPRTMSDRDIWFNSGRAAIEIRSQVDSSAEEFSSRVSDDFGDSDAAGELDDAPQRVSRAARDAVPRNRAFAIDSNVRQVAAIKYSHLPLAAWLLALLAVCSFSESRFRRNVANRVMDQSGGVA
jgi:hypothetical protein